MKSLSLNSGGHQIGLLDEANGDVMLKGSRLFESDVMMGLQKSVSYLSDARSLDPVEAKLKSIVSLEDQEDAFFVADISVVRRQLRRWRDKLPRIEPFYAVKCNPDPVILSALDNLGVGFDCASRSEISEIIELGVDPSRIIYANPCKQVSHVRFAESNGIKLMTFDNADELLKIKRHFPNADLVLRIITDDSRSVCKLSTKFGAPLDITKSLLQKAKELDLNVVGVSFHVGSGCYDANAFRDAVYSARKVFDEAKKVGFSPHLLDVGGGFPGTDDGVSFEEIAEVLSKSIDRLFPRNVRVIAEPGRFFVSAAFTLAVHVSSRRAILDSNNEHSFMYYVNDGVYGSFNCILFDHAIVEAKVLQVSGEFAYDKKWDGSSIYKCSIWGPTCDSLDCIKKNALLPLLEVGDWIYFENMGAYTSSAASNFNGFQKTNIHYVDAEVELCPKEIFK